MGFEIKDYLNIFIIKLRYMKKLLLLILIASPVWVFAQSKALSGKWREVKRTMEGYNKEFADTIKVDFLEGQEYTWMKKGGFIYRGTYKIEGKILDMGSRVFTIVSQKDNKLVLRDDDAVYDFEPYTEAAPSVLPEEAAPVAVEDRGEIVGRWDVFKRTSATTQKKIDYTTLVKSVVIFETKDDAGNWGYVAASSDPLSVPSWQVDRFENGTLYCKGKSQRSFQVSKSGAQLILKEGPMTYFLKQFKQ